MQTDVEAPPSDEIQLYTYGEAQAKLKISRTAFYRLVATGELETVQIGRSVRVSARALHDFIRRHRRRPMIGAGAAA